MSIPTSQFILPSFPPCNPQFIDSSWPYDKNHKSTPCSRIRCKSHTNINTGWRVEISFSFLPGPISPLQSPTECPAVTTVSRGVCFLLHPSMNFPIWRSFFVPCAWRMSVQFSSVAQLCSTLCSPTNCSTPGFPVHHQRPELTQTHVHWVSDAIQPSHPLSSPSPPAFNLSRHQGVYQWVSSSHQVAKILEFQLQHQSFQWMNIQDWFPLGLTGWISSQFKGLWRVFSNTTVQKHQFFRAQLSL